MFLLNSRIPLVRFSSESVVNCVSRKDFPSLQSSSALKPIPEQILVPPHQAPHPTLRANPFPEVTDLICRIPLFTLFYRPEAANLGDLMRLWVRPGVMG
jgi:hypothetical protein